MINSYDIETYLNSDGTHSSYCICYIVNNNIFYVYFINDDTDIIIKSLDNIFKEIKKKKCVLYVHNLNFDGSLLIVSLVKYKNYKFTCFIHKMNIYSIKVFNGDYEIEFKCSYKLLPFSLKYISEKFNLQKKLIFPYFFSSRNNLFYIGDIPDEIFFSSRESYNEFCGENIFFNFKEYSIKYCSRDVEITAAFVKILLNLLSNFKINLNNIYSAPSMSFNIFIKNFNHYNLSVKNSSFFDDFIRKSYYGGRCEVYGNPYDNEKVFHFDFSGMYAQCMNEKFPNGDFNVVYKNFDLNIPGFYYIKYESQDMYIPVLPHHSKKNSKLMFVNGINEGCYWHEEINLFISRGGKIFDIKTAIVFEKYEYIFSDFISFFNKIKKKSEIHKSFGKLVINSLYGRLGMSKIETYTFFIEDKKFYEIEEKIKVISLKIIENIYIVEVEIDDFSSKILKIKKNRNKRNVAIASSITSKARIKLYKAQESVFENGGRLLYSDTDSIFASYTRDVINEIHGEVIWYDNKTNTIIQDCVFISPKTYAYISKDIVSIKIKGFSNNYIDFYTLKEKFYSDNNNEVIIKEQRQIFKKNFLLTEKNIDKTIELNSYDKRKFIDYKKKTKAFTIIDFDYR